MPEYIERVGCEFCRSEYTKSDWATGGAHDFRLHDGTLYYFDNQSGWEGMTVNYCPNCGARMNLDIQKGETHD